MIKTGCKTSVSDHQKMDFFNVIPIIDVEEIRFRSTTFSLHTPRKNRARVKGM